MSEFLEKDINTQEVINLDDIPPYDLGILPTLKWAMEKNISLEKIPYDLNWCGSNYKCYYGGVIPGYFQAKEAATNFVMTSMNNVKVADNPNIPITTQMVTDSFFIILMDIRQENNIKSHFFFYDGAETLKNMKKHSLVLKEFSTENIGEWRKPWEKIQKIQFDHYNIELNDMFKNFSEKVAAQQITNEQHTEDHCDCCKTDDACECTGNQ